jgi:hypothetical protein
LFALLGLRALYFLVTGLLSRLVYLSAGLAVILAFIGTKLILHWAHGLSHAVPEISTGLSLAFIGEVLAITTAASLAKSRRDPAARAHAGADLGTPGRTGPGDGSPASGNSPAERPGTQQGHRPPSWTRSCPAGAFPPPGWCLRTLSALTCGGHQRAAGPQLRHGHEQPGQVLGPTRLRVHAAA